ncbi:MAG: hypothetical protein KF889_08025 [Alphaproteobacteria bacterium]|nr:hypothetical protein [Alphaproteobacteria bacterium]MCW5740765.1 hypothetical protein [Alphaproteobacteria bacterium]
MARIRTIKPEFFRHHGLWTAERESGLPLRVAFAGLWCAADREGRFRWQPLVLKLDVLPFDDVDFAAVLEALLKHGFVRRYAVDGAAYGVIPSFARHQLINNREKPSTLPAPVDDACGTREGNAEAEGEREGEGEGNGVPSETAAADAATVVFNQGRQWLQRATGKPDGQCRSLLGKWRRDHGDAALIAVLGAAQRAGPIDAVQWIEAALRKPPRGPTAASPGFNL